MNVFAISDLHLPGGDKKPMDIFGAHWTGHFDKIQEDWRARVAEEDIVLLPGDISWAMRLEDAAGDLMAIAALPGRKVLLRGNHDYWWSSITRLRALLPQGTYALQNDALALDHVVLCGTRGWVSPDMASFDADDARIYARELLRLELSLDRAKALADTLVSQGIQPWFIAMLHYPPFGERHLPTEATNLLTRYGVADAVYGHLHGPGLQGAFSGVLEGVRYHQTSCDGLNFVLHRLTPDS